MIKGRSIILGGNEYIVPPLSLGSVEVFQDRLSAYKGGSAKEDIKLVIDVSHAALKRNYPDLTRDQVGDLIDLDNMGEVMLAVMNASGLTQRSADPGNV